MTPDSLIAITLVVMMAGFVASGLFAFPVLEMMLSIGRPAATILVLAGVAYAYFKGYIFTALAGSFLSIYLLKQLWVWYPAGDKRRLYLDELRDTARFDPSTSIDLQFANGTAVHDSPNMLHKDKDVSPLLVYPPSKSVLTSLSG
jgi:hypothetical protein